MLKLNDVCDEQFQLNCLGVRLLFRREEEEMTSQTAVQMFVVQTVVILVLFVTVAETEFGLATVISVEDVQSDL